MIGFQCLYTEKSMGSLFPKEHCISCTQSININPLWDFRYVATATRYAALAMFASQTRDLYHIETDRKGGYIEFAVWQIYRAERGEEYQQIASVDTDSVLAKKRGQKMFSHSLSSSCR